MNEMYTPDGWGRKMRGEPAYYQSSVSDRAAGNKTQQPMTEKSTSAIMLDIGSYYLAHGCNHCDFYKVAKVCDAVPIECCWMKLYHYFEGLEEEEREKTEAGV